MCETYHIGAQECHSAASGDDVEGDGVGSCLESTRGNVDVVDLTKATISTPRDAAGVEVLRRSGSRPSPRVDNSLGPSTGKALRRGDAEGHGAAGDAGEVEVDLLSVVDLLEEGHGHIVVRG